MSKVQLSWSVVLIIILRVGQAQDSLLIPNLNEHVFLNSELLMDPFTNTSFKLHMSYGQSGSTVFPAFEIGDTVINVTTGSLIFVNLDAQFNLNLNDWASFYYNITGSARVGVEPSSLLSNGLNTFIGNNLGWKIRISRGDKHKLSTFLGIGNYRISVTNIGRYVTDLIAGSPNANLSQEVNILQGDVRLLYALGISKTVGLQAMGKFTYGDSFFSELSEETFGATLGMDFNFYAKYRVPLGLNLAYGYASYPEYNLAQIDESSIFGGQLSYTGSEAFFIAFTFAYFETLYQRNILGAPQTIDLSVSSAGLKMIIYFR